VSASVALAVQGTRVPGGRRRLERDLRRLGDYAAARAASDVDLSFAVLDDARMQDLNREALGHDYATDVLSFPFEAEPVLVGEVVLSGDTARREAAARGHSAYHELLLYAVHGVLHLLGYEDHDPAGRRRMRRAERAALAALGIPPVFGRRGAGRAGGDSRESQ